MQNDPSTSIPAPAPQPVYAPGQIGLDQSKVQNYLRQRRAEQSMPLAILAGVVAALIGAVLWGIVSDVTDYQIGWMAVGVGFLVGYSVQFLGKGIDPPFRYVGAICSLAGCVVGNFFAVVGAIAQQNHVSALTVLGQIPLNVAVDVMTKAFQPMDLLFYGIAVYEGYRFSLKRLTQAELAGLQ
ncbi:MAG TPA: hypothetical protein VKT51_02495 [Candidatus Eremiobacteraceae bacterium]|nr:hypothetical protein [Candidatus Eremiobacteraceae bacterium]